MKKLRNNKIRKLLAFMVALALMVSCMPSAYTISASEAFGDGTEDIFTDGEITSEPAAEESTPDVSSADQEETEQAQQSTLTYENDSVKVTAEALEDGALPQNTALKADSINENSSVSYDTVSQKLSAAATDKGSSLRGFFAYDVYFADGDGNRVEPNGRVRVTFEYKTPAAPELTDAASTSVTVEKLHYNSSTGDTDVNTLQANEDLKVLNVNEGKQIQTLQVETGNAAVFAVMWDSPETADVETEAVSGNEDEVPIASEELTDGMDISDEPEQDAAETPAAENPEVTPEAEPSEEPAENPDAEPTEAPAEDPDVVEEPAEDIASPDEVPAADENGETSLIEVLGDDTNLRVSPSIEAEVLATVNAGTQLTLLDTVTAEDGATWYKVSWEGTEAYIRSDMAQVVDSSDEAEEPEDVQEEEIQPEITRYDYKSDEVNVKVTLTDPADLPDNAELSVTPVELSQEAKDQITEEAIKEKKAIENIHSYDIKFLVDGEEVQPGASVKVSVSLNDEKKIKDADVYHVDENDNVENMDGSVAKNGDVEFETTHFSTYVIVNNSLSGKVRVTLQHYYDSTKIYADTVCNIEVGGKIPDYRATENYDIKKVVFVKDGTETQVSNIHEVQVVSDTVVKIYYTPLKKVINGDVVFYDYQINPKTKKSINDKSHYPEDSKKNNRMIMGTKKQASLDYDAYGDNEKNANTYNGQNVTTGLVTGLSSDYKTVLWKVDQPGFFTDENLGEGKDKYTNYKLQLQKSGNNYKLTGVKQPGGKTFTCNEDGSGFFPLTGDLTVDNSSYGAKWYFGMRYDIEFTLGDYVGPLDYNFTGDDDLWVLLDGKVVIDVGGIHDAISKGTNLWENLGYKNGARPKTDQEKNKTHRLTVLYMERGGNESNCKMNFTIPDARFVNVENVPLADITLHKVDSKGKGVSGAKFKLVNDNGGETYPVTTSDANGNVTFNNLKEGTYTLTETMAPDGYVALKENYKVKVTVNGETATAKLYKAGGTTEIENKQITNYTEREEAEKNLTSSKTAEVVDYENRIYKINLNAETTGREGDVEAKGASVVMVLDASGSMNDNIGNTNTTKLAALKNAANTFIDTLKSKSPESEIAIIWYSGSEGSSTSITNSGFKQLNEQGVSNLKSTISDKKQGSGGTPMGVALKTAKDQLSKASHENKYVVFMTDGLPGHQSGNDNWNCMVANNAVNNANSIKEQATLYTVGVGLNDEGSFNWKLGHSSNTSSNSGHGSGYYSHESITGSEFLSEYIATKSSDGTKQYAYDTSGLNDLVNTFNVIAGSIGDLFTVQPEEIVDVIDARFKLTDDGLNDLAINRRLGTGKIKTNNDGSKEIIWTDSTTGSEVGKVTIVEQADGTTKIIWTEQAARIGNAATENEKDKGWNASFRIQAKEDFIGGNMIPTNGADSGIYLDSGGIKKFEQPSVNVKLLSLSIGNDKTTVFKGDPINTRNYGNALAETIAVVELNGSTKTLTAVNPQDNGKVKLPELTDDQISNLSKNKVLIIGDNPDNPPYKYTYPGSNEAVGYFTYTYTLAKGDNADNHVATAVGNEVEKYQLTVTYHPYSESDRSNILSETGVQQPDEEKGGTQVNSNLEAIGNYVVNVVAGNIQIIKKLDVEAEQNETFNFTITDENDQTVATATAVIKKDKKEAKAVFTLAKGVNAKLESDNTKLSELSRGGYKVVESLGADVHYELQEIATVDGTNCHSVIARDQQQKATDITFTMGTDTATNEVLKNGNTDKINGQIGIVKFTNKKTVVNINLEKVDSQTADTKLSGAKFDLYKADANGEKTDKAIRSYTSVQHGAISIENLPIGQYVLIETEAPTGYMVSAKPWNIVVANDRTVTVTYNGKNVKSRQDNDTIYYQITNAKVYSLPESGGPGTYGFTISGVAILATALLLFINNKRREEEAKKS